MLTFEQAKLQFNPDPKWRPIPGSLDYRKVEAIMVMSGTPLPESMIGRAGVKPIKTKKYSKKEFMTIESNKKYILEHIQNNK